MASFQAKTGWKRQRKSDNNNYRSVPARHIIENSNKIAKKLKNLKKYGCGFISSQNRL